MRSLPSPYARLYKHALESIFAHLDLSDLAHISATCRDWSAAVESMRPIGGARLVVSTKKLNAISKSRLMVRHVADIRATFGGHGHGLAGLCDIIKRSRSLKKIDLSDNSICDDDDGSSPSIADAIKQSKSLTSVNLSNNKIGGVGASALAEAIRTAGQFAAGLSTLVLSFNSLGDVGVAAIQLTSGKTRTPTFFISLFLHACDGVA